MSLNKESINHLLLHCPVATDLRSTFCFFFLPFSGHAFIIKDAHESWSLWTVDKAIKNIWKMISGCIFWCLWIERNSRCFDGISTSNNSRLDV